LRLPTPIETKANPVPADERLGLNNGHDGEDRREPTIKLHEEQTIAASQKGPTLDLTSQDKDLMPQQRTLGDEVALRAEGQGHNSL
jgi:hypothetical protein